MALETQQLQDYEEKGFTVVRNLIAADTVATLCREIDALHGRMARDAPPGVVLSWEEEFDADKAPRIRQLMNSEIVSPTIEAILQSDDMLDVIEQLIGPDIILYHSKLLMKAAHDGTFTPWHQDWGYWHKASREPSQINCMLSIDAAMPDNGCIRFVERSHNQGSIDHQKFESTSFNIGLNGDINAYEATLVETGPGDGVFFGPLVIHGSAPNKSGRDRRANTFAFDRPENRLKDREERILRRKKGRV